MVVQESLELVQSVNDFDQIQDLDQEENNKNPLQKDHGNKLILHHKEESVNPQQNRDHSSWFGSFWNEVKKRTILHH